MALDLNFGGMLSGIGGLLQANELAKMNKTQQQLGQQGLQMAQLNADRAYELSTAANTDVLGNMSYYSPTKGFGTQLSPVGQALVDQTTNEQLRQFDDLGLRREGLQANAQRRQAEGNAADALLAEYTSGPRYDTNTLKSALRERGQIGLNQGFDKTMRGVNMQANRAETSAAPIIAEIARQHAEATRQNELDAEINAPSLYEQLEAARMGRTLAPYGTLASRASNFEDVPFNPPDIAGASSGVVNAMASRGLGATQVANAGEQAAMRNALSVPSYSPWATYGIGAGALTNELTGYNGRQRAEDKALLNRWLTK